LLVVTDLSAYIYIYWYDHWFQLFDSVRCMWQPLAVPGRIIVGEGMLTKMCRKKPKPRQFFLFSDILVYGNIVIQGKKVYIDHLFAHFYIWLTIIISIGSSLLLMLVC